MTAKKIDHLVLPVGDLNRARGRLSDLGFTVAPDAVHPFGTANACVFLADGTYLEPLAIADRRKASAAAKRGNVFVSRDIAFRGRRGRQGLSSIVVASDDAAADRQRYIAAGLSAGDELEFSRTIMSLNGDETEGRFRLAFAADEAAPDFFAFACQRVVSFPQDMGDLRAHSNAVTGLKDVVLAARDPGAALPLLGEVLGVDAEDGDAGLVFSAENARVRILGEGLLEQEFGLKLDETISGFYGVAIIFRSADLAVTEIVLAANDVAFIRRDGRVLVQPAAGQGVVFGFEE